MAHPAKVTTPFPSVFETAKKLGVSKHEALVLSEMAERSVKSGVFSIPGVGRLVRHLLCAAAGQHDLLAAQPAADPAALPV